MPPKRDSKTAEKVKQPTSSGKEVINISLLNRLERVEGLLGGLSAKLSSFEEQQEAVPTVTSSLKYSSNDISIIKARIDQVLPNIFVKSLNPSKAAILSMNS